MVRVLLPVSAVEAAIWAEKRPWGLLNLVDWSPAVKFCVAILILDFALYLQHVLFHAVPLLWRLHMVHHADLDFDVTTGVRFHFLEILLSAWIKLALVLLVGPPAVGIVIFEVLLNATSTFNHSNVRLSQSIDRFLRLFIVTPDMHRVHYSIERHEQDSNFGFNLPWWDFLFGTYRPQPEAGHENMVIGVAHLRLAHQVSRLDRILLLPFLVRPVRNGSSPTNGKGGRGV